MAKKILSLAAVCLIAGGCGTTGTSSRGGGALFSSLPGSKSSQSSFRREVENDPFPAANNLHTADMQVRVRQL